MGDTHPSIFVKSALSAKICAPCRVEKCPIQVINRNFCNKKHHCNNFLGVRPWPLNNHIQLPLISKLLCCSAPSISNLPFKVSCSHPKLQMLPTFQPAVLFKVHFYCTCHRHHANWSWITSAQERCRGLVPRCENREGNHA